MSGSCEKYTYAQLINPKKGDPIVIIKTSMGDITVRLFPEYAPKAVENFTTHAKAGYYNGVTFHRVIKDFMIQGGDPTGTGSGGESIWGEAFEDEVVEELHNVRGALSMANAGRNTNGSQFFIVQKGDIGETLKTEFNKSIKDTKYETSFNAGYSAYKLADRIPVEFLKYYVENGGAPHLDYPGINYGNRYTVFGQVIDGMDVVDAIAAVETNSNDKPLEDVVILSIEISEYSK